MELTNFDSYIKHSLTGSAYICDPPVSDTDIDYLVLTDDKSDFLDEASRKGWSVHSDDDYPECDDFVSVRKGRINLIVTEDLYFYGRFRTATELCREINVLEKSRRVEIFQGVLYGNIGEV